MLHHADLIPSNILLDDENRVKVLLDLDGLAFCDEYTMLSQILLFWQGVSVDRVVNIYQTVFDCDLDIKYLERLLRFKKLKNKISATLRKVKQK